MDRSLGIAIIGSGMTGLTAADLLVKSGRDVVIFDKGRRGGGWITTRHSRVGLFDQTAPGLNTSSEEFLKFLQSLGAVSSEDGAFYGLPSMRALLKPLLEGKSVRHGAEVAEIARESRGWVVRLANGRSVAHFHSVLLTPPAPQAADLIQDVAPGLAEELRAVRMPAVWSCLAEFDRPLTLPGKVDGKGLVMRADRMAPKPGQTGTREAWVIHMVPQFMPDDFFADPAIVAPMILDVFAETFDICLSPVRYLDAHRWRYAFADQPLGRPFLGDPEAGLLVGGDWTLGRRAEHGFQSGREMAMAILSREVVKV